MKLKIISFLLFVVIHNIGFGQEERLKTDNKSNYSILKNYDKAEVIRKHNLDTWILDSTYTYIFQSEYDSVAEERVYYSYVNQNETQYLSQYYFNSMDSWINDKKYVWFSDNEGNDTLTLRFKWSVDSWEFVSKSIDKYNSDGQVVEEKYYTWDTTSQIWLKNTKAKFFYNEQGQIISNILYSGSMVPNTWTPLEKDSIIYNINSKKKLKITYRWNIDQSKWINFDKVEYFYENQFNSTFVYYWEGNKWNIFKKYETHFDGEFPDSSNTYILKEGSWKHTGKSSLEYNQFGTLISQEGYYWDDQLLWVGDVKYYKVFDEQNLINENVRFYWIHSTSEWVFNTKRVYSRNQDHITNYTKLLGWDEECNCWKSGSSNLYYFKNISYLEEMYESESLHCYPNPARLELNINIDNISSVVEYKIYNLSGQEIQSNSRYVTTYPINISNLQPGNYIIKITSDRGIQTGHFIKTR